MRRFPPLLAAAIALAGCGSGAPDRSGRDATLAIGGTPGAVHAGIYLAVQRGFDEAEGVMLHPTPVRDPVRTLTTATAQAALAVLDIHELAIARARGVDVVAVMAIVGRPVAELRPARLRRPTQRPPGAPDYPELVLAVLRSTITDDEGTVRGAVAALQRGYREAYIDPESAVQALATAVPSLQAATIATTLDRLGPDFQASLRTYGELDPARLRAWAAWEPRTGLVKRPPDVARAFDGRFVKPG
jgi:ABC-type nitrate/sulfonate/bicarbonate transport system substrate-binding protein